MQSNYKNKKMKNVLTLSLALIFVSSSLNMFSQSENIDAKTLEILRENYKKNAEKDKAVRNALSNNDIRSLALNRDITGKTEHNFKYKVDVKGITDQKSSGRCWLFTALNILRPVIIKSEELSSFEFSTNYLYFYDMLEKSNLFLSLTIQNSSKSMSDRTVEWLLKNPISDGGVWSSFANLIEKYGVVPKQIMPETYHSENSSWLNQILTRKLREDALILRKMQSDKKSSKDINDKKVEMISEIYRLLVLFLGEPPVEFSYRFITKDSKIGEYKTYTPQSFFKTMFPTYNVSDYVMLMNDPSREYYKMYEIEYDRNTVEGRNWIYLNLPATELKKVAILSIKDNTALYASCDVGKQLNRNEGTLDLNNYDFESLLGVKFGMNKAERINSFDSGSSHAMLLMAVDTDNDDNPVKWQFENSWGASSGYNGYLTFTDEWFTEYMFRIVIDKKYLDANILKMLDQKPIMLPPYDPMFAK